MSAAAGTSRKATGDGAAGVAASSALEPRPFVRESMLAAADGGSFDVLVVGGGATGLGVAVDAASRGCTTCLFESHDFAKGTSSRSTKLVHGGVRYLEQLDIALVLEALRERGIMHENAPHLVHDLPFIVPRYAWWEAPFYGAGLKLYDLLAGKRNLAPTQFLSRDDTIAAIPNVARDHLLGGVRYHDGQFDDARMALSLARTAAGLGAVLANGVRVDALMKDAHGMVCGVRATDVESDRSIEVRAKVVVNACGIFADGLRKVDDPAQHAMIEPAQGVHLVLDRSFLAGREAIMVPHTDDGRVLFVIPWHDCVVVGTTDTPMPEAQHEPRAMPEEIEFILRNAARYLERDPARADVRSVFAGQRPLVHEGGRDGPTKSISRTHKVVVSPSGLVTIVGGKWTTYRKMAEDTMARALDVAGVAPRPCVTESLRIHGYLPAGDPAMPTDDWLRVYGSDAAAVRAVCAESAALGSAIAPSLPYLMGAVAYAARHEMARSLDDCLARRTRALLLDARAASGAADAAAAVLAKELGRDAAWARDEAARFRTLAERYILEP